MNKHLRGALNRKFQNYGYEENIMNLIRGDMEVIITTDIDRRIKKAKRKLKMSTTTEKERLDEINNYLNTVIKYEHPLPLYQGSESGKLLNNLKTALKPITLFYHMVVNATESVFNTVMNKIISCINYFRNKKR